MCFLVGNPGDEDYSFDIYSERGEDSSKIDLLSTQRAANNQNERVRVFVLTIFNMVFIDKNA